MGREPTTAAVLILLALALAGSILCAPRAAPSAGVRAWADGHCGACHRVGLWEQGSRPVEGSASAGSVRELGGGRLGPELSGVLSLRGRAWVEQVITRGAPGMPASTLDPLSLPALMALLEAHDHRRVER